MHLTGPGGRLNVHVDFNLIQDRSLHRRVNLLLSFVPKLSRCVIFEASDISFRGVVPVSPAAPYPRISFAAYCYTREAPPDWDRELHSTIFKAQPEERLRGLVLMPAEKMQRSLVSGLRTIKRTAKGRTVAIAPGQSLSREVQKCAS